MRLLILMHFAAQKHTSQINRQYIMNYVGSLKLRFGSGQLVAPKTIKMATPDLPGQEMILEHS